MPTHVEDVLTPRRTARLAARVRATKLDRQLIDGANPAVSPQLAARAAQLTARRMRTAIAEGLQRLVSGARGGSGPSRVPPARATITANATQLDELAGLLRSDALLYAQGVAILHELVVDGAGPAYRSDGCAALARKLEDARRAL